MLLDRITPFMLPDFTQKKGGVHETENTSSHLRHRRRPQQRSVCPLPKHSMQGASKPCAAIRFPLPVKKQKRQFPVLTTASSGGRPKMFGAIYKAGEAVDRVRFRSPVYYANTLYAKKLAAYILEEKFDAVVCTHLFAMEALTYIKKRGLLTVPSYGVLTDYTCIPFFEETDVDEYFIPHADLADELCAKGMKKERLIPTGIRFAAVYASYGKVCGTRTARSSAG